MYQVLGAPDWNSDFILETERRTIALFEERSPLYEKYADIQITEGNLNVEQTVEKIIEKL